MSEDRTPEQVSGIGLPDETITVWRDESSLTEQGPRSGAPEVVEGADPDGPPVSYMLLSTSGPQTDPIEVRAARGGLPTRDSSGQRAVQQSAGVHWRPEGGAWRGFDPPRTISRWEHVEAHQDAGSGAAVEAARDADHVIIEDGTRVICYESIDTTASGPWRLRVRRRRPGETDQVIDVETLTDDQGARLRPTICQLPDGRLMLYRYLVRGVYSGLRLWYSVDDGDTWVHGGDGLVDESLASVSGATLLHPDRLRVRASGQTLILLASTLIGADRVILQYGSSDGGNHFQRVHTAGLESGFDMPAGTTLDAAATPGGGYVVIVRDYFRDGGGPGTASGVSVGRLSSPYLRLDSAQWLRLDDSARRACVAVDESGVLLALVGRRALSGGVNVTTDFRSFASFDGGRSWTEYFVLPASTSSDAVYDNMGGFTFALRGVDVPEDLSLAVGRGRGSLIHRWDTDGTIVWGASLGMAYLGGWSTLTRPLARASESEVDSTGWVRSYVPVELPAYYDDWTNDDSGTVTRTIVGQALRINAGNSSGNEASHRRDLPLSASAVMQSRIVFEHSGLVSTQIMRLCTAQSTSGDRIAASVEIVGTLLMLAGATTSGVNTNGGRLEVVLEVSHLGPAPTARMWWRNFEDGEDRPFSSPVSVDPVVLSSSETQEIRFGALLTGVSGGSPVIVDIYEFDHTYATPRYSPDDPPTGLLARTVAGRPYLGSGVYLQARQGPAYAQERWLIRPDPDYAIERAVLDSSPRVPWRAIGVGDESLALRFASRRSPLLAIGIRASNASRYLVEVWSGGAWVSLGRAEMGWITQATLLGPRRIRLDSITLGDGRYLHQNELVGAWVQSVGERARVVWSSEGVVGDSSLPLVIEVDTDMTLPSQLRVYWPDATILADLADHPDATGVRLTVDDGLGASPPEGYWEIGAIALRWVHPWGMSPDWSATYSDRINVEGDRTRDRLWRGVQVAPPERSVTLEWPTVPETDLDDPSIGYVQSSGSRVAERGLARALVAYLRHVGGPRSPVMWLPELPAGSMGSSLRVILGRSGGIHGRIITTQLDQQEQAGSTYRTRVITGGAITIEEDV